MDVVKVQTAVIGAGVVGLSIARELSGCGHDVVVLESEANIGLGVSSRNSEVIHAGIYYPQGSLKALACYEGKQLLYDYCESNGIAYQRCGKLIVATDTQQLDQLASIEARARANGVKDLVLLNGQEAMSLEPQLSVTGALLSPSTGIIDSHGFMQSLEKDIADANGIVSCNARVEAIEYSSGEFLLEVAGSPRYQIRSRNLINAAGLEAVGLLRRFKAFNPAMIPQQYCAKGTYFYVDGKASFKHLVYPVPQSGGLGIHLTLDLAGRLKFGPDVEWLSFPNFQVDEEKQPHFKKAVAHYWPEIINRKLVPAYAGVRPKLVGQGQADADFLLQTSAVHGIKNLVNLLGIESPGLTSALSIAKWVSRQFVMS